MTSKVKFGLIALFVVVLAIVGVRHVPADVAQFPQCLSCGSDRHQCSQSRVVAKFSDGSERGDCSLHCLVNALVDQPRRKTEQLLAADYVENRLVPAEQAFWVEFDNDSRCRGGKGYLAFRTDESRKRFISSYGGAGVPFYEAVRRVRADAARGEGSNDKG